MLEPGDLVRREIEEYDCLETGGWEITKSIILILQY
jgi:hypothetical protein